MPYFIAPLKTPLYLKVCGEFPDDVPAVSVALSFFITAGLLGTTIASGALAIASANLASAGAFSSQTGCVGADPSRNLLVRGHALLLLVAL